MGFGGFISSIAGGLTGLGKATGGLGGQDFESFPTGGYATLPDEVKEAYEETYLPDVLEYYNSPYHNVPMIRSEFFETDPRFASSADRDWET